MKNFWLILGLGLLTACQPQSQVTKETSALEQLRTGGSLLPQPDKISLSGLQQSLSSVTNSSTTASSTWDRAINLLSPYPLIQSDAKSGLIISDWFNKDKDLKIRYKITVHQGKSSFVKVFRRKATSTSWTDIGEDTAWAQKLYHLIFQQ